MFVSSGNINFSLTFANGNTVSVGFGPGHRCSRYLTAPLNEPMKTYNWESITAEIAAWNDEQQMHYFQPVEGGDIAQNQTADQVLALSLIHI